MIDDFSLGLKLLTDSLALPEFSRAMCWWHRHTPGFSPVPEHFPTERLLTALTGGATLGKRL